MIRTKEFLPGLYSNISNQPPIMKKVCTSLLLFTLLVLFSHSSLKAQYFRAGLAFSNPVGALDQAGFRGGLGWEIDVLSKEALPRFPLNFQYGAHFDLLNHGNETFPINLSNHELQFTNSSIGTHLTGRVITRSAALRFYAEAYLGARLFYTQSKMVDRGNWDDDIDDDIDWFGGNLGGYYGWGFGGQFHVSDRYFIDFRASNYIGSGIGFVDLGSLNYQDGFNSYAVTQSPSHHLLNFQVGVHYRIGEDPREEAKRKKQRKRHSPPPVKRPSPAPFPNGEKAPPPLPRG
jgi:hypothetical protein